MIMIKVIFIMIGIIIEHNSCDGPGGFPMSLIVQGLRRVAVIPAIPHRARE
jgi:hypothetical protein